MYGVVRRQEQEAWRRGDVAKNSPETFSGVTTKYLSNYDFCANDIN